MVAIAAPTLRPRPSYGRPPLLRPLRLVSEHTARRVDREIVAWVLASVLVFCAFAFLVITPGAGAAPAPELSHHVVAEGESLWSIAVEHARAGEAAPYVERVVEMNGSGVVTPGQVITLPAP